MTVAEQNNRIWFVPVSLWAMFVVAMALIGFAFADTVGDMVYRWDTKKEYGYGYLIPVITLFLLWQRKSDIAQVEFRPTWWGVLVVVLGGALHFLGAVATTHTLSQYALVITLLGIALGVMGWRGFRIVAMPLVFLFLMVPLPPFLYNNLSTKLQLISSELGVAVIRLFGISVYIEGNVIDLGSYKLQVVEACNGLRYLFPLVSLAFVMVYLYQVELWKRMVVFLSSIPITVLMNSFRIGVIGVLVEYGGPQQAEGFLHDFEGWAIFMACFAILLLEMIVFAQIGPVKRSLKEVFGIEIPTPLPADVVRERRSIGAQHFAIVITLGVLSLASVYVQVRENIQPARRMFAEFPLVIGEWRGQAERLEQIYLRSLKLDDYMLANYANKGGQTINFYVAYYAAQEAGEAAHSPRACIPGGGWLVKDHRVVALDNSTHGGQPLRVNRILIKKGGGSDQLVYYWFRQRGRDITSEYMVKWHLFQDALTRNRTDGALIRLVTTMQAGEAEAAADQRLHRFVEAVTPMLDQYVPD